MNVVRFPGPHPAPSTLTPEWGRRLAQMRSALEGPRFDRIPAAAAPSEWEREVMRQRLAKLVAWLEPAPTEFVVAQITLFGSMRVRVNEERDVKRIVFPSYVSALAQTPAFALTKACSDFRCGELGGGVWAPTPGELRLAALAIAAPWQREKREIETVLAAAVGPQSRIDPARVRQVADAFRRSAAEAIPKNEAGLPLAAARSEPPRETPVQTLVRLRARVDDPPLPSEALRASIERRWPAPAVATQAPAEGDENAPETPIGAVETPSRPEA